MLSTSLLAALPLIFNPPWGPLLNRRQFFRIEVTLKSQTPPAAAAGRAAVRPVAGQKPQCYLYPKLFIHGALQNTKGAVPLSYGSQQTTDTRETTENNQPLLSATKYPTRLARPPPLPLFLLLPSPAQSYYGNRLLINTSGFPFPKCL